MQIDITQGDIAKAREHPDLMDAALAIKLQYAGSDLTAAIAALLVRLAQGKDSTWGKMADGR